MAYASDAELSHAATRLLELTDASSIFGCGTHPTTVARVSATERRLDLHVAVDGSVASAAGVLDEGWAGIMADNLTSILFILFTGAMVHVSTALSLRTLAPVRPAVSGILVECALDHAAQSLHATVVFRDAAHPETVYATASHTKFLRPKQPARI
ncbi:hypothetical protein LPJ61_005458 [Coemansia biformis]|uniref:Thioesterase domain-containing protein n=1 Tax=Coemansia biformis TaxID=1286918 RepID=A0A9W7Y7K8_9FUNG|nr:hypothetical protein LPJ61_005458 [Coemansia biformis]